MVDTSATANELRRALSDLCEFCGKELRGHRFALFASRIGNPNDLPESDPFNQSFGRCRWRDLRTINEFDGSKDAAVVYAIECPNSVGPNGPIYDMVLVRKPFELYAYDEVIERFAAVLDDADIVRSLIVADEWQVF